MGRVPSRGSEQFIVRFPDGMRDRIKAAADANGRSMNSEIISALGEKYPTEPSLEEAIEAIQDLVNLVNRTRIPELRDPIMKAVHEVDKAFNAIAPQLRSKIERETKDKDKSE